MARRRFLKYQGIGNDFILLDLRGDPAGTTAIDAAEATRLCHRRFGIGADGLLLVFDGPRMAVINADGSRPEMCGNGLRCVARYLDEVGEPVEVIQTDAGPHRAWVRPEDVEIALPSARDLGEASIEIEGRVFEGRRISTGNPHFVLFGAWSEADVRCWGPQIERHAMFPKGVNVSFATILGPAHVNLLVWERGCGATLACGTAATATACAGWLEDRLDPSVRVRLPGGRLWISGGVAAPRLRGPAERVFEGVITTEGG
ncbi:diaminopimelate epimerase [Myxococcota bacterium]|nr:diaminopimelate epimerase [Myxococcota bacterium]MBU1432027.1 diaminopimelate epimerase [Myxococcota bacterium]MBU1899681.1 diaminopimelate epimerase [Myxococcota bacterium]